MNTSESLQAAEKLAGQKRWDEAASALQGAGESTQVLEKRCFYLSRAGQYEEAVELLKLLRERLPNSARIPYMLGYQYSQRERYAEAIVHFEQAVGLDPRYLKAHYRLAQAHAHANHKLPAQLAAMKVRRLWRESDEEAQKRDARMYARACYLLAKLQLREEPEGSVTLLKDAVKHEPADHNKHYLLGKALTRAGDPSGALAPLREAKRIEPRKVYIDIEIVHALLDSDDHEQAKAKLREVTGRCRAWDAYNAARLAKRLDEFGLARDLLESADRRGPTRGNPLVKDQLRSLPAVSASNPKGKSKPAKAGDRDSRTGEVVYLNPRRHFGFLVDQEGVKRHFPLKESEGLNKGNRVIFVPTEQTKGPAARDVRAAS